MAEELVLLTRLSDLLCWLLPKSEKFPRAYRFTVTQRMMDAALDCQEAVFAAQSHRGETRKVSLRTADAALTIGCGFICASRTAGSGSATGSTSMQANRLPKSADCSAAGSVRPDRGGRRGSESRRRPVSICARRDATTCGRDSPAPSNRVPASAGKPWSASISGSARSAVQEHAYDVGRTQNPKPDIVVAVVRIVVVAGGRARVVCIIVPGATAHHPGHVSGNPTELHSANGL